MAMSEQLRVALDMDASGYISEARKAARATDNIADTARKTGRSGGRAMDGITGSLGKLGKAAAGAFAVAQVGQFVKGAVDAAADLGESVNAVQVVFGEGAQTLLDYGETAATSVGLAQTEFNSLATNSGALLTNFGFTQQQAAEESINLTERAADMASVFNTDVGEALFAVQAGLRGETEPLRRFGVSLDDATIRARAVELGLAATTAEVDKNGKATAALSLFYEQTSKVQGDFANTSDSLANSQRILAAEWENAKADIGQALLPLFTSLVATVRDLMPEIVAVGKAFADVLASVQPLVTLLLKGLSPVLQGIAGYLGLVGDGTTALMALFGDEASKATLRFKEALENLEDTIAEGGDGAVAYANGLVHMGESGALTAERMDELASGVEFVGQQQAVAIRMARDWAMENGAAQDQIDLLNEALYEQVSAMIAAGEADEALIEELGLTELAAEAAAAGLEEIEGAGEDAAGGMEEATEAADDLRSKLDAARIAQESLSDVLKAAADPAFAAVKAFQDYQQTLADIDEDGARTAEEQLELAAAVLEAQGALDAFNAGGVEDAAGAIAQALGIGTQEAKDLLEQLGILDGSKVTTVVDIQVDTTLNPVREARAAASERRRELVTERYSGRQHGGLVEAGTPYIVGEAGAELFVPSTSGTIVPGSLTTNTLTGGSRSISIEVNNPTTENLDRDLQVALLQAEVSGLIGGDF